MATNQCNSVAFRSTAESNRWAYREILNIAVSGAQQATRVLVIAAIINNFKIGAQIDWNHYWWQTAGQVKSILVFKENCSHWGWIMGYRWAKPCTVSLFIFQFRILNKSWSNSFTNFLKLDNCTYMVQRFELFSGNWLKIRYRVDQQRIRSSNFDKF
jgi:hypothetical protein